MSENTLNKNEENSTTTSSASERIRELEKRLVDTEQQYQMLVIKFVNYIQAIESSTTLIKDALRHTNRP
jgi:molecular chaperone GrpE (heat shock protein)